MLSCWPGHVREKCVHNVKSGFHATLWACPPSTLFGGGVVSERSPLPLRGCFAI